MRLYDDNGHEVTNHVMLKALKVLEKIIAKHGDYSDIELYDDYGNRVTNVATLRSIAEAQEREAIEQILESLRDNNS